MTAAVTHTPTSDAPTSTGHPVRDAELLRRFVRRGDEQAFAELAGRHSRLVIGVCRRVLRCEHDVEDVFQATFLVLARDAARIRKLPSLASWLHGVAYRTSLRAIDSSSRRRRLLRDLAMNDDTEISTVDALALLEERQQRLALDEELAALSDNDRAPLVLHYLEGKTNQQVADELGTTVAAVEGRLKRGKKELRLRLARRGIGLSVAVAAMHAVQSSVSASTLNPLIARTIDAGLSYAGGEPPGPVFTPEAARLAGQEILAMSTTTAATLTAALLIPLVLVIPGDSTVVGNDQPSTAISTEVTTDETPATSVTSALVESSTPQVAPTPRPNLILESGAVSPDGTGIGIVMTGMEGVPATSASQDVLVYDTHSENEQRILAELDKQSQVEFVDTPFSDVIDFLAHQHNIRILVDEAALSDNGIATDTPINLILQGVKLRSVLNHLLRPHDLTAIVRDEVMTITTNDVASNQYETRIYNTRSLGDISDDRLTDLLEEATVDTNWNDDGGTISAIDGGLVIKQTQAGHEQVANLLSQLRRKHLAEQQPSAMSGTPGTGLGGMMGSSFDRRGMMGGSFGAGGMGIGGGMGASGGGGASGMGAMMGMLEQPAMQQPALQPSVTHEHPKSDENTPRLVIYDVDELAESLVPKPERTDEDMAGPGGGGFGGLGIAKQGAINTISQIFQMGAMKSDIPFSSERLPDGTIAVMTTPTGHRIVEETLETLREHARQHPNPEPNGRFGGGGGGFF